MHKLPEIVRAIALNNKIDESRYFAEMVQRAMVRRCRPATSTCANRRQAGAVRRPDRRRDAERARGKSFVTNNQDAALLKTGAYRQQIAEALLDAVLRYQASLKKMRSASATSTAR